MKKNILLIAFTQLIPARVVEVKKDGKPTGETRNVAARTPAISFKMETDKEVTARNYAEWFVVQMRNFLKLRVLQGKESFQTSKPITVAMSFTENLDGKEKTAHLTTETKLTINIERIEKCLERNENLIALIAQVQSAPKFGAPSKDVRAYLTSTPSNVVLLTSKATAKKELKTSDVPEAELVEKS